MELDQANRHTTCNGDLDPAAYADVGAGADSPLLAACLDGLMRYLLTGCRLHAERARLLLERAEDDGLGDAAQQMLFRQMSEHLRQGDLPGQVIGTERRGTAHV